MRDRPTYFDPIQNYALAEWDALDRSSWKNSVLLLFSDVQSPQHVISELLQNADDAGARWASISIDTDDFVFEHDGDDFTEEQLTSLCSFGISSKASLHTIGFRGIGFKSVFSLGPRVQITTPTLTFEFTDDRFTIPLWSSDGPPTERTVVRITLRDAATRQRAADEIESWYAQPAPLLFFQNIQALDLQGKSVRKERLGAGPVSNAEWVRISGRETQVLLHIVSEEELFPSDALTEIMKERGDSDGKLNIRSCRVDIVLCENDEPRLYVVLPTDVRPKLSFSCNAPFLQDPSRKAIKDPVNSPTNRWLLGRIGNLAASALLEWLGNRELPIRDRAMAYDLVSHPQRVDTSIDGVVTSTVLEAFEKGIDRHPVLLSSSGSLQGSGTCLGIPSPLFSVWDDQVLLRIFADDYAHLLAPQISPLSQQRLQAWSLLNTISPGVAATKLMSYDGTVPKPDADRLLNLWSFLETAISQWSYQQKTEVATLPIVPVEGEEHLSRSSNVVQIGAQSRSLSDDDMGFLLRFVSVADRSWMSQFSEPHDHENNDERVQNARSLLRRLELSRPATIADLIRRAATAVFDSDDPGDNGFTIARLAAQAEISADHNYRFRCRDGRWRSSNDGLIIAPTGPMERLLPESWCDARALDDEYEYGLGISGRGAWRDWAIAKGGLTAFPRPRPVEVRLTGEKKLRQFFHERGGVPPTEQRIQRKSYVCVDHDFDAELWSYWESVSTADSRIWSSVVDGLLDAGQVPTSQVKVFQMGVSQRHELNHQPLRARWVLRLQSLPCVVDTFGRPSIPSELLRVTPQNAFLQDIERFIAPEIDRPENAWLLDLLGVRSDPSTTEVPLTRLRALASVSNPPMSALASLYKTLDRLVPNLDSNRVSELRKAFETERLIFARNGSWQSVAGIVQQDEAGTPGVLTIHREIAELDLSLWDRLGVARRASLDRVLDWLNQMPRFERIDDQTLPLVREVLAAYPSEVWHRCGAWIDMTGRWTPARDLRWWVSRRKVSSSLVPKVSASDR